MSLRRTTSGKSTPPSGARLHKNVFGLRPLHVFVPPHFAAGTLCTIIFEFVGKTLDKIKKLVNISI